jgi:hypothetical protein
MVFEKWFEVEFIHEYYRNENGRLSRSGADLEPEPTSACAELMTDRKLLFRRTPRGFLVFYRGKDPSSGETGFLAEMAGDLKLSFHLRQMDPFLGNYSDLPMDSRQGVYFLDNLGAAHRTDPATGADEILLSGDLASPGGRDPYLSGSDFMPLRSMVFTHSFPHSGTRVRFQIKDFQGTVLREETLVGSAGEFQALVDLAGRPEGVYSLWVDGLQIHAFYAGDDALRKKPFGILELYKSDAVPADCRLTEASHRPIHRIYTARLKNRETIWRYHVALKYRTELPVSRLKIVKEKNPVVFSAGTVDVRPDGMRVVSFDSGSSRLPLRKDPLTGLRLVQVPEAAPPEGEEPVLTEVAVLPNPSPANLSKVGNTVFSDIFIFV